MTVLQVGEEKYKIQFRHQSKLTKRKSLHRAPMNVLTTCVVTHDKFVAIGHAMCMPGDNFSKKLSRDSSFLRAVGDCVPLNDVRERLISAYRELSPEEPPRPFVLTSSQRKEIVIALAEIAKGTNVSEEARVKLLEAAETLKITPRQTLPAEERESLINAGIAVREARSTQEGRARINADKRLARRRAKEGKPAAARPATGGGFLGAS